VSALAFHDLTDQMPRRVWMAIGASDWAPAQSYPPIRAVRFAETHLRTGIEHHVIAGVRVPVYSIAKTLADAFRNPRLVDRSVAIEGLRNAIRRRQVPLSALVASARDGRAWNTMRPYLEALASDSL
jgi:predicted transcriptional regulator of viral defense system